MILKDKKRLLTLLGISVLMLVGISSYSQSKGADDMSETKSFKTSWQSFPYKSKGTSSNNLIVEREVPNSITPGREYTFSLRVINKSMYKIDGVILSEKVPDNFKFIKADPRPVVKGNTLQWNMGMMAAGQKEIITITGKAFNAGKIEHSGKVDLNYELGQMTTLMEVIEPKLYFGIDSPKNVTIFDTFPATFEFKNTGTAPVLNAVLKEQLPVGVKVNGQKYLNLNIGTIQPNISKKVKVDIEALKEGSFNAKLTAKGDGGIKVSQYLKFFVGKPKLFIDAKVPRKRFVGNNIPYSIKITNTGNAEATDVNVAMNIPTDAKFVSANEGGELKDSELEWDLTSLQAKESKTLRVVLVAKKIMTLKAKAVVKAKSADARSIYFTTNIEGIPALLLVLSDVNDPVPVGETETYSISVKNQGSLAAENVVIKCDLEPSMEFVTVTGPTGKSSLKGNKLTLKSLRSLKAGDEAVWNVTVKAKKAGDNRFKVYLESKHLTRPVYESESTHFYD